MGLMWVEAGKVAKDYAWTEVLRMHWVSKLLAEVIGKTQSFTQSLCPPQSLVETLGTRFGKTCQSCLGETIEFNSPGHRE